MGETIRICRDCGLTLGAETQSCPLCGAALFCPALERRSAPDLALSVMSVGVALALMSALAQAV